MIENIEGIDYLLDCDHYEKDVGDDNNDDMYYVDDDEDDDRQ